MKALLYKDFLVLWKQMKFVIFMVAIFCLLPNRKTRETPSVP